MSLEQFLADTMPANEPVSALDLANAATKPRSEKFNNRLAAEHASVRAVLDPTKSFYDLYEESKGLVAQSQDPRAELFVPLADKFKAQQMDNLKASAVTRLRNGEPLAAVMSHLSTSMSIFGNSQSVDVNVLMQGVVSESPGNVYREMSAAADASPFVYMADRMEKEGRTGVDAEDFLDVAGLIAWPDVTIDTNTFVRKVKDAGILDAKDMKDFAGKYSQLNPSQKEELWAKASPILWDAFDGNDFKMAIVVEGLLSYDPEYEQNFNLGLDILTAVGTALDAKMIYSGVRAIGGKYAAGMAARRKMTQHETALRNAARPDAAADASIIRAGETGDALTAAKNASPYDLEGTVLDGPGVVDGIAPEMQARLLGGEIHDTDQLVHAARTEALAAKANELDLWIQEQETLAGGRSVKDLQAELSNIQAQRASVDGRSSLAKDLEQQGVRAQKALDAAEAAQLGKQYARSMRAGKVPEEFADDIRAAEQRALDAWDDAPVHHAATARRAEKAAQEAEIAKIRDELGVELQSVGTLSKVEIQELRMEHAGLGRRIKVAKAEGNEALVQKLKAERAGIAARLAEHKTAEGIGARIAALDNRDLTTSQRARLRAVVKSMRAGRPAQATPLAQAGAAVPAATSGGASAQQLAAVQAGTKEIGDVLDLYKSGEGYIDVAKAMFTNAVRNADLEELAAQGHKVRSVRLVSSTDEGITLRYTTDDGDIVRDRTWDMDALGNWSVDQMDDSAWALLKHLSEFSLSPTTVLKNLDKDIVANMTLGGMQSSTIFNNLIRLAKNIDKNLGLSTKEKRSVAELLEEGDRAGVVYDVDLLLNTSTVLGRTFSEKEVLAYYQWRRLYDGLWSIQNAAAQRSMHFQGYRELQLHGVDDAMAAAVSGRPTKGIASTWSVPVRRATDEEASHFGMRRDKGSEVTKEDPVYLLDDTGIVPGTLNHQGLAEHLAQGWELHRLHSGAKVSNGASEFILIRPGEKIKLEKLRNIVLHYEVGYVPRIYSPGQFFVKSVRTGKTVAGFRGKKEANAWIASKGKDGIWRVRADKDMLPEEIEIEKLNSAGGLWYMPRRGKEVPYGDTEQGLDRLDLGEATQSYLRSVSEILPLNEYRSGVMRQFTQAVNAAAKKYKGDGFKDPSDIMRSEISTGSSVADQALLYSRQYLQKQISGKTLEESKMNTFLSGMIDHMEGRPILGGKIRNATQWALNTDPIARAKAAVFHTFLGMFNPVQFFVQSQNAFNAALVYPQHAIPAVLEAMKMRMILTMDKEAVLALSQRSGLGLEQSFEDLGRLGWWDQYRTGARVDASAFKRSGYRDSIFREGDFVYATNGISGYTMEGVRRVLSTGAIPFEEGEMFARLVAFCIAKREYVTTSKSARTFDNTGVQMYDDAAIQEIVQNSLRINMNLQKENAAIYQSNSITALPTQFLQVYTKFYENVLGGLINDTGTVTGKHTGLTRAEAARVAAGHLAVYGAVGVPLMSSVFDKMVKEMGYTDSDGNLDRQKFMLDHPQLVELFSEGLMGQYMSALGLNVNVTDRFSLMAGLDDTTIATIASAIVNSPDPLSREGLDLEKISPFMAVSTRAVDKVSKAGMRLRIMLDKPEATPYQVRMALWDVVQIASTFNNLERRRLWNVTQKLHSRTGNETLAWNSEIMNLQTDFAVMMGLRTDEEVQAWAAATENMELEGLEDEAQMLVRLAYIKTFDQDEDMAAGYMQAARDVLNNDAEFKQLKERTIQKMIKGETAQDRTDKELLKKYMNGTDVKSNLMD